MSSIYNTCAWARACGDSCWPRCGFQRAWSTPAPDPNTQSAGAAARRRSIPHAIQVYIGRAKKNKLKKLLHVCQCLLIVVMTVDKNQ